MQIALPWLLLMGFQAYQHGYKQKKMPEPFYFIAGSAVMVIASIIGMANSRVGGLAAWAFLLGAIVAKYKKDGEITTAPMSEDIGYRIDVIGPEPYSGTDPARRTNTLAGAASGGTLQ